jgi:hypothetical protein
MLKLGNEFAKTCNFFVERKCYGENMGMQKPAECRFYSEEN